jgi:hypothetical protein
MKYEYIYLPYCLQQVSEDRWVILNRKYKPVGMTTSDWVDYEAHAVPLKLTAARIARLSWEGSDRYVPCRTSENGRTKAIYLYNYSPTQTPAEWRAYQKRLETLAKLKIE